MDCMGNAGMPPVEPTPRPEVLGVSDGSDGEGAAGDEEVKFTETDDVRNVIRDLQHNQTEIVPAPRQLLEQLPQQYIDGLETIPVNPEAPWDEAGEEILRCWMAEAEAASKAHQATGYKLKRRYKALQFAVISSAVALFLINSLVPCNADLVGHIVHVVFSAINLLVAQITGFLNYGSKYQEHFEYEGHYSRYAIDIMEILATDTDFRAPKDKTIAELRERKKQLVSAPEL